jgi:hypothetical protein
MSQAGAGYPCWTIARFLATGPEGLRTLYETRPRPKQRSQRDWSPDWPVVVSLASVLERQGLQSVGQLGNEAAASWARRIGVVR